MPQHTDYNVDISNILGGFESGNINDMMNYLLQTLGSAGYFTGEDTDWQSELYAGHEDPWSQVAHGHGDTGIAGGGGFTNWTEFSTALQDDPSQFGGYGDVLGELGSALAYVDPENLQEQYASGFSDISGAYQSGMKNLKKARGIGSKGGRYGSVATGGRNVGKKGGRQQYMSDYYDLTSNYQSGISNLQSGIEGSFRDALAQYMTMNPSLPEDE